MRIHSRFLVYLEFKVWGFFWRKENLKLIFFLQYLKYELPFSASSNGKYRSSDRVPKRFSFSADIFVFLLSTRAGGLGINLTAADTVRQLKEVIVNEKTLDGWAILKAPWALYTPTSVCIFSILQ